ncbi:hypothetical protein ACHAXA_000023 [Cyclostephanos tholiformis]|uniref:Uncharacterized protein n=1 Tax=Cyclostephanos tholiformis TaxID=382380 RepID=A0ABD3SQS1_9STRA
MTTTPPAADGDYHFTLVPMLLSMSHVHLASRAVSKAIAMGGIGYHSSSSLSPEYHFWRSLHHWPRNPIAHSLFANYRRMNGSSSLASMCDMYQRLLILNGALDVEYIGGDVDHVDNEEGEEKNEDETENDDGVYSSSSVKATA